MSVAEQPVTEKVARSPSVQLAQESLAGGVLLLVGLWVLLAGLPLVWPRLINDFLTGALLFIVTVAAAVGFGYVLLQLDKSRNRHGLRAGTFVSAILLYFIARITLGIGHVMEDREFGVVGIVITVVIGLGLLFLLYKWMGLPGFGAWLGRLQDAGWFDANVFKGNQGIRIRRLTVIALLVLGFWGIITMINQRFLGSERPNQPNNWQLEIPFTGDEKITRKIPAGDYKNETVTAVNVKELETVKKGQELLIIKSAEGDKAVTAPMDGKIVKMNAGISKDKQVPDETLFEIENVRDPVMLPLIFRVHVVVPLLLGLLLMWLAWRIVNLPSFSDFLIATEAEMNKVSWSSRKRLVQDTIVVLVTLVLMTTFLFVVDILWIKILSNDWVYVLQVDTREAREKLQEKAQW